MKILLLYLLPATPQPCILESLRLKNSCAISSAETKSRGRPDKKQRMPQPSALDEWTRGLILHREHKPAVVSSLSWHKSHLHSLAAAPQCALIQNPHSCTPKYIPRSLYLCITVKTTSLETVPLKTLQGKNYTFLL